jgi:small basic protein
MIRATGKWFLAVGVAMLIAGIAVALTIGTVLAAMLVIGSVIMNTAAVVCIRRRDNG